MKIASLIGKQRDFQVKQTIYLVKSDNYDGAYMTAEAYKALTLQMSSGDHGSHKAERVSKLPKGADLLTLNDIDPDAAMTKALKSYPKELQEYAAKASFRAGMRKGGLDSYSNYGGPDFGLWVVSVGTNRDADLLTRANFEAALELFGGESDTVQVNRFGHWGCGWFELIMIDPRDRKALETAYSIHKGLQDYPVIDDLHYSELESEERESDFENYQSEFELTVLNVLGLERDELERSMSKAEFARFESDLTQLTRIIHEYDCGYRGTEDAFVTDEAVIRALESESWAVINLCPYLGDYALAVVGLEVNPNFEPYCERAKAYPKGPKVIEISAG